MFKATFSILISGLFILPGFSQKTQDRQVDDFTALKVSSNIKVMLSQGDANTVKVEADEEDIAMVKTEVKDGCLNVSGEGKGDITVYITAKMLNSIEANGAALVKSQNQFSADKLNLEAGGAGTLKLLVKVNEISGNASGASVINLSGNAQSLIMDVTGAASLKAYNLETEKASISTGGAGSAKVNVVQSLAAKSSGASSITFKGDPKDKSLEMSGASSISTWSGVELHSGKSKDTTKMHIGGNNVIIYDDGENKEEHKHRHSHHHGIDYWSGIEFGVNGYLNAQNSLSMPAGSGFLELNYAKSLDFNLNLFEKDVHICKNYVNLVTGLGFEFNHYSFRNPVTLIPNAKYISATSDSLITYNRNKLNESFVTIPLMIMFNTNDEHPSKGFHIGAGIIGGYKIRSITKQCYILSGYEYSVNRKDDYNLNPFRLSATVRAGFGGFNLFASYALTPLFEDGKGPQLYPFTLGISLTGG